MMVLKKGDKVRLTKDENVLIGEVLANGLLRVDAGDVSNTLVITWQSLGWNVELVHRPVELPTEFGLYLDRDNDVWVHDGYELTLHDTGSAFSDSKPDNYAPFRRLYTLEEAGDVFWGKLVDTGTYDPYDSFQQDYIRKVLKGEK